MRAGTLRHIIIIEEQSDASDGMGGFTNTWGTVTGMGAVPAAIWPFKATETVQAMQLEEKITHRIRIRYRSGITAKNRIKFGSRIFNIISLINVDERNISLDILATEEI